MSPAQTEAFARQGYLRLEGFHPRRILEPIRKKVLAELERVGVSADGKRVPKQLKGLPVFQQIARVSSQVRVPGLHEALVTPELSDCITRLGRQVPSGIQETQVLLSPSRQGTWSMEGLNWHVDVATRQQMPGIQAFFLIDDVAPKGGATLALAGSHRASTPRATTAALRAILESSEALERDLQRQSISIVEMSGQAGDLYLMDMRVLHTPSINASDRVRMMATCRWFLSS